MPSVRRRNLPGQWVWHQRPEMCRPPRSSAIAPRASHCGTPWSVPHVPVLLLARTSAQSDAPSAAPRVDRRRLAQSSAASRPLRELRRGIQPTGRPVPDRIVFRVPMFVISSASRATDRRPSTSRCHLHIAQAWRCFSPWLPITLSPDIFFVPAAWLILAKMPFKPSFHPTVFRGFQRIRPDDSRQSNSLSLTPAPYFVDSAGPCWTQSKRLPEEPFQ